MRVVGRVLLYLLVGVSEGKPHPRPLPEKRRAICRRALLRLFLTFHRRGVGGEVDLPCHLDETGGEVNAVVALGAVVQGATAHASLINETTSKAFCRISLETGVPVVDGIVSAESLEQAIERCGTKQGNKGFSAMQAAIETVNVLKGL